MIIASSAAPSGDRRNPIAADLRDALAHPGRVELLVSVLVDGLHG